MVDNADDLIALLREGRLVRVISRERAPRIAFRVLQEKDERVRDDGLAGRAALPETFLVNRLRSGVNVLSATCARSLGLGDPVGLGHGEGAARRDVVPKVDDQ